MRAVDLGALTRIGWYDPSAPDAADKRAMLELLESHGVDVDQVLAAIAGGYVQSAGLLPLLRTGDCSARDAARALGEPVDGVVDTYRLLGVRIDDVDEPILRSAEIDLLKVLRASEQNFDPDEIAEINRTTAASLTALTESIVSVFVGGAEARMQMAPAIGWVERTERTQAAGELGLRFGEGVGLFFRHHLRQAVDNQRTSMAAASDRHLRRMTVGFVDLVGFTALSATMEVHELVEFIRDFERRSYDVASRAGGRIVKIIGDEVMLSALDPEVASDIALQLIDEFRTGGAAPRGGMASGEVIGRLGDFFGPVVNLASRLVDHAVPGEILADAALSSELGVRFACEPAGRRMLKGFAEPVEVVSVRRS